LSLDYASQEERLVDIVRRFSQRRIVVIGDAIADQFVHGGISRVSREAPVFIIRHEHTQTVPGGAANCAVNLASLGAKVSLVSIVGEDEAGRALLEQLKNASLDCSGVITSAAVKTTTKVRILAGLAHSTRQQVVRIDYEGEPHNDGEIKARLRELIEQQAQTADAIIISDYNYGVADEDFSESIRARAGAKGIPVLVDSRFRLMSFTNFTSATPNETELEQLLGGNSNSIPQLTEAGEQIRKRLGYQALLITRGSEGMMLLEEGQPALNLKAIGGHDPVDVTGAGDTVIATYTLALASAAPFADAARLANYAGGLVVMKRGTASVTAQELEDSVLHSRVYE
jgi:rfaE bifunctional protein kinase chain/domain